ncbi:hypothetical protein [Nitrobacter vulgaris]|uniref:hypothetical protein n=1 Tax=Nitrobacter vulgaris TaxID=29421 RepID=UPI001FCE040A|nr:hypothetical protein [Nitrobacter vulgaris]
MRFWVPILGLTIGLQSACIPAQSDELGSSRTPVAEVQFPPAHLIKDVADHPRAGSVVQVSEVSAEKGEVSAEKELPAEKEEVPAEREREHGARSPLEMLTWFLKGAASLTAMVLFYKGLKWWVFRKRQSE